MHIKYTKHIKIVAMLVVVFLLSGTAAAFRVYGPDSGDQLKEAQPANGTTENNDATNKGQRPSSVSPTTKSNAPTTPNGTTVPATATSPSTQSTTLTSAESPGGASIPSPTAPGVSPPLPAAPSPKTLLSNNFNGLAVANPITATNYKSAMGDPGMTAGSSTVTNTSVVAVAGRGNVLRQFLPSGSFGSSQGIVTFPSLSQVVDEAYIQYDIRFSSGFDWSKGGKLPGLGGVETGYTPGSVTGCVDNTAHGWSGRGMWITPASYAGSSSSPNEWIGYMYNPGKSETCGDNVQSNKSFGAGTWHTVKQYYKLNSVGSSNGVHTMWLDGVEVFNRTNFVYRTSANVHITHIYWSIFRGGSTSDWAGTSDGSIDIDNLLVIGY